MVHSLRSNTLVIGHPHPTEHTDWGVEFSENFQTATQLLKTQNFRVIIYEYKEQANLFSNQVQEQNPETLQIVITKNSKLNALRELINNGHVFRLAKSFHDAKLENYLKEALEQYDLNRQEKDLLRLTNEQNQLLKESTDSLEERIKKRQTSLKNAELKLHLTNKHIQALHACLLIAHKARSISEMDSLLNRTLIQALGLKWVRVMFQSQSSLGSHESLSATHSIFQVPWLIDKDLSGEILFAREKSQAFSKSEKHFLQQVAEAITLAISRLTKLEQSETLKHQWESTFDAIAEPLCLTDENFNILKTNRAFASAIGIDIRKLNGKACFETFFGFLPEKIKFDEIFRLTHSNGIEPKTYEILLQELPPEEDRAKIFLVMMKNISEQLKLERQVLESSKLAEIGTIGSSIAHELNNPLGGMLSFTQLIAMDLPKTDKHYADIIEMEIGILKCRDIVQNLLGFARRSQDSEKRVINFKEVIQQSIKIIELTSRSKGIQLTVNLPPDEAFIEGQFNLLSQAINNILQNAVEAIAAKMAKNPRFIGHIKLDLRLADSKIFLSITDNGIGIAEEIRHKIFNPLFTTKAAGPNPGLGLTVAYKIIRSSNGQLEISSQSGEGTTAIISFERPDLKSASQVFDRKI